jgi:pimeloyl-ACP methyl ester carboxylesterase
MTPRDRFVDIGIQLHIREWPGVSEPFLLLHGLASNCQTWDFVAARLSEAGHAVVAVDQRGHGLSQRPEAGYDFGTVTEDLARLLDALGWQRPIVVGQSWGGSVVLRFGARNPGRARGLALVDGGFMDLQSLPDATWDGISKKLTPPDLRGRSRDEVGALIRSAHPDWTESAIQATLANFETLPDGTVRPWLTLERHMAILRAMWEQKTAELYPLVREPVLICVAQEGEATSEVRERHIAAAQAGLRRAATRWFKNTAHDIHLHRPALLARMFLAQLKTGIWAQTP